MSDSSNTIIVIPARGGSKRLPRKNVKPLAGKPLICWTIKAAIKANLDAKIIVTSDDGEILELTDSYKNKGVFKRKRPAELASDTASSVDAVIDVIESESGLGNNPQTIILLQPTSPLRNEEDIFNAFQLYKDETTNGNKDTVVSVCEVEHPTAWVGQVDEDMSFTGTELLNKRSQDYEKEYRLNGAVYVCSVEHVMSEKSLFTNNLKASIMPRHRSIDIDEEIDFKVCEGLLNG
ncbi:acylneuraminate cytidylyltransferase family protein [Idiomarina aminovorans]|uniref:acylneuraminate cytidylyltransferase family protein n=1 Tax=Idiomarina aminovorans TaxID=2914829 RepID=UPI002006CE24|nr:acylneuraminate cytidylyltransferase family protein [Idiomarina sp. ATCH4]MCK7459134.1 acylneuraminate cytidylyltransferase family protein [Idiomarina sp. ATCH4]